MYGIPITLNCSFPFLVEDKVGRWCLLAWQEEGNGTVLQGSSGLDAVLAERGGSVERIAMYASMPRTTAIRCGRSIGARRGTVVRSNDGINRTVSVGGFRYGHVQLDPEGQQRPGFVISAAKGGL